MYLKRLELHGFKTFATRTTLDFERGVTAVVGPNGSGKSNLSDAVRWALGEQNLRHVRCRQAEDLIFAGTSAARGQGARAAMGVAEVSMTLDNSAGWLPVEYDEVRIGRRLYRSGDTEYLLNGARVRLRDITDLLARASISAGSHLVIGQGLVDTVLNWRPEERRALIETLAGLRFYYSRRDEAEAKVRAAEANVQNVEVMIAEATPHIALLRDQAATYARYREAERELRALLLQHYAAAYAQAVERRQRLDAALVAARLALDVVAAAVRTAADEVSERRTHLRTVGGEVATLRGDVRSAHEARERAERDLAVTRTRREAAASRLADLQRDLPPLERRWEEAVAEGKAATAAVEAAERERVSVQAAQGSIEKAVEAATEAVSAAESALRALAERRRGLERQEATASAEREAVGREEAAATESDRHLRADDEALTRSLHAANRGLEESRRALDTAQTTLDERRGAESTARLLAADSAERARQAANERRTAVRRTEELEARAAGLRTWLEAMSGGGTGTTVVATALVAESTVEGALAAALGPLLAAGGIAPQATAAEATAALQGGARALLLPARAALGPQAQAALEDDLRRGGVEPTAIVGWGDRLATVEAEPSVAAPLRAALSTLLVLRDLSTAWQGHATLCALEQHDAALVVLATLSGEALLPSGLLVHPSGDGVAVLERVRERRTVETALTEALIQRRQAEAAAQAAEATNRERTTAAEAAQRALRAAEGERNTRRAEAIAAERTVAQATKEAAWAAERMARAAAAALARTERRRQSEEVLIATHAALRALDDEETPLLTRQAAARAALQEATARRAEQGAARAMAAERATTATKRHTVAQEALHRLDDDLRGRRSALTRLEGEVQGFVAAEADLAAQQEAAIARSRALYERLRPLESDLAAVEERLNALEQLLATHRPEEGRARAAQEAAALALQRAEHEVASVSAAVGADLALDPLDLPPPQPVPPSLTGRIKALRAQLHAAGPVNARAPDDLATATERQEFLHAQATDLRDGIARLRLLIAEANATVRERFGAVTGELDAQFRVYLQQLFNGGRGELTALYDEAGLPSGLEIVAQPPGKRTSELALLSGGERALVGLALVFAMLHVRPVPFCVLDEAEAALDEANTLRVGEILRSLSAQTQFIVITHNRGTMSQADALYGVTMAESGLSQVASLRLEEIDAVRRSRAG